MSSNNRLSSVKCEDTGWAKVVLSSAVAVLGGVGCWALLRHLRSKKVVHHDRKRTLDADYQLMRKMKKEKETGSFLGGTTIEG